MDGFINGSKSVHVFLMDCLHGLEESYGAKHLKVKVLKKFKV